MKKNVFSIHVLISLRVKRDNPKIDFDYACLIIFSKTLNKEMTELYLASI